MTARNEMQQSGLQREAGAASRTPAKPLFPHNLGLKSRRTVPSLPRLGSDANHPGNNGEPFSQTASTSGGSGLGLGQHTPTQGHGEHQVPPGDHRGEPPQPPDVRRIGQADDDGQRGELLRRISYRHAEEREAYQKAMQGHIPRLDIEDETATAFFAPDEAYQKCEEPVRVRLKVVDSGTGHLSVIFVETRTFESEGDMLRSDAEFKKIVRSRNIDGDQVPPEGVDPMRWEYSGNLEHDEKALYAFDLLQFGVTDADLVVKSERFHPDFQDTEVVEAIHKAQREFAQVQGYRLLLFTNYQEPRGNGLPYYQLPDAHNRLQFQLELERIETSTVIIDDLSTPYVPF